MEVITLMMECVDFGLPGFLELAVVICYVFPKASFAKAENSFEAEAYIPCLFFLFNQTFCRGAA